ncbi:MAG: hypothetical protein GWN62_35690 [Aliifodinibius sp.]|nr:hypothetical protein [Fodinibius sp.]
MPEFSHGIHLQKAAGQRYTIHIPYRYTLDEKVSLVFLLHWGGKKYRYISKDMLEIFGLPAVSELQAIVIAPDLKRRHWATPKALSDISKLVDYLDQHYNLYSNRRTIIGFSMGGGGVWYVGAEKPSLFSCGVSIASPIPEHITEEKWNFPVYSIHGRSDEFFPHEENLSRASMLKEKGAPVEFETVENTMHTDFRNYINIFGNARQWIREIWGKNGK